MVATAAEVQRVEGELKRCVAALQFEAAATLRDRLKALKAELAAGEAEVQRLEAELQQRIEALEFEAAAQLRDRIKALRSSLGTAPAPAGETTAQQDGRKLPEQTLGAVASPHQTTKKEKSRQRREEEETRKVFIGRLPLSTRKADLRRRFPKPVQITLHQGKQAYSYAFLLFPTVAEAEAAAARGKVQIGNKTCSLAMSGDKAAIKQIKYECNSRTVFFGQLPLTTDKEKVMQHFPTLEAVTLLPGKSHTAAFVQFSTEAEAQSVASQGRVTLEGRSIPVCMSGDRTRMAKVRSRTVALHALPLTTDEAALAQHFPAAEQVHLLPGRFHAVALVRFPTAAEAQSVAAQGVIRLGGRSVSVSMEGIKRTTEDRTEEEGRTVFVSGLAPTTNQNDLEQCFPTAERIRLACKESRTFAFVTFPDAEEALAVAQQAEVVVAGQTVAVCMHDAERGQKRPTTETFLAAKRSKPSPIGA